MARPWLFLDLDGVVSPLSPRDVVDDDERFAIPAGHMTWLDDPRRGDPQPRRRWRR